MGSKREMPRRRAAAVPRIELLCVGFADTRERGARLRGSAALGILNDCYDDVEVGG